MLFRRYSQLIYIYRMCTPFIWSLGGIHSLYIYTVCVLRSYDLHEVFTAYMYIPYVYSVHMKRAYERSTHTVYIYKLWKTITNSWKTVMVNNSSNVNRSNNQLVEHEKDIDMIFFIRKNTLCIDMCTITYSSVAFSIFVFWCEHQELERSHMCVGVGVSILPLSMILLLDVRTVQTVWYVLCFIL
jgi:hypothetical protein